MTGREFREMRHLKKLLFYQCSSETGKTGFQGLHPGAKKKISSPAGPPILSWGGCGGGGEGGYRVGEGTCRFEKETTSALGGQGGKDGVLRGAVVS